ncbi:hypothetical protein Taro_012694 [Colocasia esculenta]|uniref:Uncharacterized protein n=1 Tax=Colocasia esculenta TaxID=4460 RepID=A0A843U4N1_COLES|nr:hypothetical protein [Colocasia esculenta]
MNASTLLDAIPGTASMTRGTGFRLASDRGAEEALSGTGEELMWLLWRISGGFDIVKARAVREPREDDARSVGVLSARRFWCASASSAGWLEGHKVTDDKPFLTLVYRELVSSVGRLCQPICTAGSLSGIAEEEGDTIMNASALLDAIPGTASVTRGTGFRLASDRGDTFKGFKCSVCPGCDFDQSVKSFVSARQSRGGSVRCRGGATVASPMDFWRFRHREGSCGMGTTRGRCSKRGRAVGEEILVCFGVFCR